MDSQPRTLWKRLVTIAKPYFRSEARHRAHAGLAVLVVLLLSVNGLNVVNSYVGRFFMNALGDRNLREFYLYALALTAVFAASTAAQVVATYVQQNIVLRWREWLTHYLLDRYLGNRAYRRLSSREEIDNPDQRISEDIRTFTDSTIGFLVLLFNAALTLIAFAGVLWSIRPVLLIAAAAYALLGSLGTILLGRPLVRLDNLQLKKEADFRFGLGRVREHAGTVAQLGGEGDERARLGSRLDVLVSNYRAIIVVSRNLGFFTTMYNFLPQIIPVILAAPLYIRGLVELGVVMQASMAFSQVLAAFSLIVSQFQALSAYAAVVTRLGGLWEATSAEEDAAAHVLAPAFVAESAIRAPAVAKQPEGHRVAYQQLTLRTPEEGRPLVQALSLEITEGKRVLVTGPSGAGKSALLLATAGLWESGEGRVVCPSGDCVLFMPEQPYASTGSLRQLLQYGTHRQIPDDRLRGALREVGLAKLADRPGGFEVERNWADVLSPSELELTAFARLLAASPKFAFLDDPADSLDAAGVKRVYEALARTPITYVSVAGHYDLQQYHDIVLELHGDGTWRVRSADGHRGERSPSAAGRL
jgi:putative ATP-binding cassette transporter